MERLVVVSNRVPLPSERGAKAGGLAVALADALQPGSLWFGWSGRRSARGSATTHIQRSEGITYATIDLTEADYRAFYVNFSNGALWPLLHFRLGLLDFRTEDYDGYRAVNRQFAAALQPLLRPDDIIWVHDYHLIPLAAELRSLGDHQSHRLLPAHPVRSAVDLQRPAPSPRAARPPVRIRRGRLPDPQYRAAFLDASPKTWRARRPRRSFAAAAARCAPSSIPIGIDADAFAQRADAAAERGPMRMAARQPGQRGLAIGVDRLDYSKGLINRFEAYRAASAQLSATSPPRQLPADRRPLARGGQGPTAAARASSTGWSATSTAATRNSTGRRCAISPGRSTAPPWPASSGCPARPGDAVARRHEPGGEGIVAAQDPDDPGVLVLSVSPARPRSCPRR